MDYSLTLCIIMSSLTESLKEEHRLKSNRERSFSEPTNNDAMSENTKKTFLFISNEIQKTSKKDKRIEIRSQVC